MAHQKKTRNLTDLAEKAGVTVATASLALRNSPRLSDAVRERIRLLAEEEGFTPRVYRRKAEAEKLPGKRFAHLGPVLFVENSTNEDDPVGMELLAELGKLMNRHGVEFRCVNRRELTQDPELFRKFSAIYFYNDPPELLPLSGRKPMVQVFGWKSYGPTCDRFTANDVEVVSIALERFLERKVERVLIVWRDDMVNIPDHPRIALFAERLRAAGVEPVLFRFDKYDTGFMERLKREIAAGSDRIGFFGFNARCGLKLCCGLDSLGLMQKYGQEDVIVCDRTAMLNSFWPRPRMIDLMLPVMAERALEALFWRMEHPDAPATVTIQSPRLLL